MGQKPPKVIYGRSVPESATRSSMRTFLREKAFRMGLVLSAGLSIASSTPENNEPAYDPDLYSDVAQDRVRAEERAMEAAYKDLVLIPTEYTAFHFVDDAPHNADSARPTAEQIEQAPDTVVNNGTYYSFNRTQMYNYYLEQFESAGMFDTDARQNANVSVYFGGEEIPAAKLARNEALAARYTDETIAAMSTGNLGQAIPMRFRREMQTPTGMRYTENTRVCRVILMPSHYTPDVYAARYTGISDLQLSQDIDMADLQQVVANHEFTHCLYAGARNETWYNESLADTYAIARHIQLNGDDEFIYQRRALRNLSVLNSGDFGHDTVPLLDRAIPGLIEAYNNGELDGLDPKELMDKTMDIALGEVEDGKRPDFEALEAEVDNRERVMTEYRDLINYDNRQMASIDRDKLRESELRNNPEDLALFESILESRNNSVEYLYFSNEQERTHVAGRPDTQGRTDVATQIGQAFEKGHTILRFNASLQELTETLATDHDRYDALGYMLYRYDKIEERWKENLSAEDYAERIARTDNTGLTYAEQREIVTAHRQVYAQRLGIEPETQEPEQEQEASRAIS